jgi:Recombination directionality factor-like
MPIRMLVPAFARLGYIKIGDKGGKSGAPIKFDHFEIRTTQRDEQGRWLPDEAMMARVGEKPTSLKIRLPFNDIDMVFSTTLAYYRGRNRFCWGDGESAQRLTVVSDGHSPRFGSPQPYGPCGEACKDFADRRCKPLATLQLILEEQQQVGGAYVFKTTSWNSIRNIASALAAIKAQTGGILAWVPLTMKLVPQVVQPKDGSPANTAYVVQIVFEGSPQQLLTTVRDLLATRAPLIQEIRELEAGLKALPEAGEDPIESADTQEEFYPELAESGPEDPHHDASPPTVEEMNALLSLLAEGYKDPAVVGARIRAAMGIPPSQELKKKQIREGLTRAQYHQLKADVDAHVRAQIAAQAHAEVEDDDDVIDPPGDVPAVEAAPSQEAAPDTDPVTAGPTDVDQSASKAPTSLASAPGRAYATPEEIADLQRLADQVGPDAYADLQDTLEHHRQRLPIAVYTQIKGYLDTRGGPPPSATAAGTDVGEI